MNSYIYKYGFMEVTIHTSFTVQRVRIIAIHRSEPALDDPALAGGWTR